MPYDFEIAAKVGYGTNPGESRSNTLGLGLGNRVGISFRHVYVGISFVDYAGSRVKPAFADGLRSVSVPSVSVHALMFGLEVGYGVAVMGLATIRPQLGVGYHDVNLPGFREDLYLEPGVAVVAPLGVCFTGVDANLLVLPLPYVSECGFCLGRTAFTLHGQFGVTF
jgi:hypothetical protein